ncbi:acyl-CoA thioesterase [Actinophytocola sp. KF-1]
MTVFVHRLRVRYNECDQQGVVFNGHYLFYYDTAITELWRDRIGPYQETVSRGFDIVVAEATLRYRSSARFDELVDIAMPVAHLGNTSMVIRPEFRVGDRLVADGEIRHVFVDPSTLVKKPMPDDIRAALAGSA